MAAKGKMAAKEKHAYGRSEENPARPNTDISKLTLRDSSGQFNNDLLEQYILLEIYTNKEKFDINAKEPGIGFTPLHWAVSCANIQGTKVLVKHGADVHVRDCMGFTPLFYCTCQFPNVEMASYLIAKCNARVDDRSDTGGTCLQGAAFKGNTDIVRCLLKFGADPKTCNKEGTTAFDFARGHQDILDLLHKANSKSDSSKDKKQRPCANCGKSDGLKRCARCQVTYYCSKECQSKHWKQGNHRSVCEEGVIAEPGRHSGYHVTLMNLLGAQKPAVAVFGGDTSQRKDLPAAKRFVVKVQRPIPSSGQNNIQNDLMVYNVDRSVDLFIKEETTGYDRVVKKITNEGIMGLKAYFWAERVPGKDKLVKVFPGKFAPPQEW